MKLILILSLVAVAFGRNAIHLEKGNILVNKVDDVTKMEIDVVAKQVRLPDMFYFAPIQKGSQADRLLTKWLNGELTATTPKIPTRPSSTTVHPGRAVTIGPLPITSTSQPITATKTSATSEIPITIPPVTPWLDVTTRKVIGVQTTRSDRYIRFQTDYIANNLNISQNSIQFQLCYLLFPSG